jgi:hypothetical protein
MHKAISHLLKDYCGEWHNPQRLPSISPVSLQKVPKPNHFFVSPLKSQSIVAAQTSTQHESLRGDAT